MSNNLSKHALIAELESFKISLPPDEQAPGAEQHPETGANQLAFSAASSVESNRLRVLATGIGSRMRGNTVSTGGRPTVSKSQLTPHKQIIRQEETVPQTQSAGETVSHTRSKA